jgi:hypothetical protein
MVNDRARRAIEQIKKKQDEKERGVGQKDPTAKG